MGFNAVGQKSRSAMVIALPRSVRRFWLNFLIFLAEKERIKLKAIGSK